MSNTSPEYNVELLRDDLALKGWRASDLARRAGVSDMAVSRFLRREAQNPRTVKKLAKALGRPLGRYLIRSSDKAVAS